MTAVFGLSLILAAANQFNVWNTGNDVAVCARNADSKSKGIIQTSVFMLPEEFFDPKEQSDKTGEGNKNAKQLPR